MPRPNKYGNAKITVNRVDGKSHRPDVADDNVFKLDSHLEQIVYQALIKDVEWQSIDRGPSIRIVEPCQLHPRGLRLVPDFRVMFPSKRHNQPFHLTPHIYVEVKGLPTLEWQRKMKQLRDANRQAYCLYLIVSPNPQLMPQDLPCVHPDKVRDFIRAYLAFDGSYAQFLNQRSQGKV